MLARGGRLDAVRGRSIHAVDAFVVATALEFELSVIATGDAKDVRRLAAPYRQISLMVL
jgi:hypothetical protein